MRPFLLATGALVILSAAAAPALAGTIYNYTGGHQTFTVPTTGLYTILAYGASGGTGNGNPGGLGAEIGDTFNLTAGDVLHIDVGGSGGHSNDPYEGGGGGGTFVVDSTTNRILAIAGGGGGAGVNDAGGNSTVIGGSGAGGSGGNFADGGGGGGYLSSGVSGNVGDGGGFGGGGYPGLAGGGGGCGGNVGGFGGGGGGSCYVGGGGGGYSGGAGGTGGPTSGAGGTSYDGISNISPMTFVAAENSGDGSVVITAAIPEPASFAMVITGLTGLLALRRRAR